LLTAALGVAIHFFLAFAFATLYCALVLCADILLRKPMLSGLIYGSLVWLFMDFLVLPRTGVTNTDFDFGLFMAFLADHAFLVGVPIALAAQRFLARQIKPAV